MSSQQLITYAVDELADGGWRLHEDSGCSLHAARGVRRALKVWGVKTRLVRVVVDFSTQPPTVNRSRLRGK